MVARQKRVLDGSPSPSGRVPYWVLDAVRTHGQRSRAEIANDTGLSAPTVSGITADLIDRNLLYEHSTGESAGGRRSAICSTNGPAFQPPSRTT